jgi:hypothetical protein
LIAEPEDVALATQISPEGLMVRRNLMLSFAFWTLVTVRSGLKPAGTVPTFTPFPDVDEIFDAGLYAP